MQQQPGRLRAWLLLLASVGCGHTEPFSTNPPGTDAPFDAGPPARLTLNQGPDRGAAWLPDGSGILYSSQQLGRRDHDVCLALIPAKIIERGVREWNFWPIQKPSKAHALKGFVGCGGKVISLTALRPIR